MKSLKSTSTEYIKLTSKIDISHPLSAKSPK